MKLSIYIVFCVLVNLAAALKDSYRAAIVRDVSNSDINAHIPAIYEAGRKNVDILVLPHSETLNSKYNYDESVKNVAKAARQARVYVAAHLHDGSDSTRTSLVFNRDGAIVSLYRKTAVTCNCSAAEEPEIFSTDFGVEFALLMEEDLALHQPALIKAKNVIVTGVWPVEVPFLTAAQLCGAWSAVSGASVLCARGVHAAGPVLPVLPVPPGLPGRRAGLLTLAEVNSNGREDLLPPPVVSPTRVSGEDLTHYNIKPLNVEASVNGYTETVCHHNFCCQFYVKASFKGSKGSSNTYGLGVYSGSRHLGYTQAVGTQVCGVFACAGLYKRSCDLGAKNSTDVIFNEITISGNFSTHTVPFPMIISSDIIDSSQYSMVNNEQISITIRDASVISFGIFGRDFTKDHEVVAEREAFADSGSLFNENVQGFIDYVWIRLRILIFVVSIYILEMM